MQQVRCSLEPDPFSLIPTSCAHTALQCNFLKTLLLPLKHLKPGLKLSKMFRSTFCGSINLFTWCISELTFHVAEGQAAKVKVTFSVTTLKVTRNMVYIPVASDPGQKSSVTVTLLTCVHAAGFCHTALYIQLPHNIMIKAEAWNSCKGPVFPAALLLCVRTNQISRFYLSELGLTG